MKFFYRKLKVYEDVFTAKTLAVLIDTANA